MSIEQQLTELETEERKLDAEFSAFYETNNRKIKGQPFDKEAFDSLLKRRETLAGKFRQANSEKRLKENQWKKYEGKVERPDFENLWESRLRVETLVAEAKKPVPRRPQYARGF